jgi:hypothetical protein
MLLCEVPTPPKQPEPLRLRRLEARPLRYEAREAGVRKRCDASQKSGATYLPRKSSRIMRNGTQLWEN